MELRILNTTTKSKRWNGKIDTLAPEYLKEVMKQMSSYGERVRFALGAAGARPYYQVINPSERTMAFDGNHHLHHPQEGEFTGAKVSATFSLEQIEIVAAGGRLPGVGRSVSGSRTRASSSGSSARTGTVASQKQDDINAEKYAYFKENRHLLPAEISEYSNEITSLMQGGISAADAFGEILKRHFP